MPKCEQCNMFLPPDFVDEVKQPENPNMAGKKICHFCQKGTDVLVGTNNTVYRKDEVVYDYSVLIKRLADSKELRKKISQAAVDKAVSNIKT